jgi:hypothetical protein
MLAEQVVATLFGGELPVLASLCVDYGGTQPARVRHISLGKDDEGNPGPTPEVYAPLFAMEDTTEQEPTFTLYDVDPADGLVPALAQAKVTRARTGVFSYSSAHALMAAAYPHQTDEQPAQP